MAWAGKRRPPDSQDKRVRTTDASRADCHGCTDLQGSSYADPVLLRSGCSLASFKPSGGHICPTTAAGSGPACGGVAGDRSAHPLWRVTPWVGDHLAPSQAAIPASSPGRARAARVPPLKVAGYNSGRRSPAPEASLAHLASADLPVLAAHLWDPPVALLGSEPRAKQSNWI
jgi:hypothetical protein